MSFRDFDALVPPVGVKVSFSVAASLPFLLTSARSFLDSLIVPVTEPAAVGVSVFEPSVLRFRIRAPFKLPGPGS